MMERRGMGLSNQDVKIIILFDREKLSILTVK
jgi:hypothetical protein